MTKRFRNLTKAQERVFGQIFLCNDLGHSRRTIDALLSLGLIEERIEIFEPYSRFPVQVKRYDIPLVVHAEWCYWCAAQPETTEQVP